LCVATKLICLVARNINHVTSLFISHTAPIQVYAHAQWLGLHVQGLRNAASTIAHSQCLAFTYNTLHKVTRIRRGWDFQKRCCCW